MKAKDFADAYTNKEMLDRFNKLAEPLGMKFVGALFARIGIDHDVEIGYEIESMGVLDKTTNANPEFKALREELLGKFGIILNSGKVHFLRPVSEVNLIDTSKIKKD